MSSKPLVSVIIIFLNEERFIQEAIESVFAQTYDNWELLLVDDGSIDGSTEIALRYTEQYSAKVCYLEHDDHQNRGMSASRNLGIRNAKGDYIAFLDADDIWLPQKLEQQVAILSSQPEAAMVYGPTQWWYSWTGNPEDMQRDFVHELSVQPNTLAKPPTLLTLFLRNEGASPCTCSVLVRREVIERIGGFEESFRGMYEDQAFCTKVYLKAPVFVADECWYRYRQHSDSSCAVAEKTGQYYFARLFFLNWLAGYLSEQGIKDTEVWQALQKELWPYRHPILYHLLGQVRQMKELKLIAWLRNGRLGVHVDSLATYRTRKERIREVLHERLPADVYIKLCNLYHSARGLAACLPSLPIIRHLRCLQFRRLRPFGNGRQRGTPIVRYYWARYLQKYQPDIHGHSLEIGTTATIQQYGGQTLTQADAIDLVAHSPEVTVVADLSRADHVPSDTYDCFVNQFTMHVIYDVEAALYHSIRVLKQGGVLLVNFSCLDYYFPKGLDMGTGAPLFLYWWFTPIQVENLLRRVGLAETDYKLDIYGNLFARIAYQMNIPAEELTQYELEYVDAGHPLLICVRVVKPATWQATKPEYRNPWLPEVTPAQWNPVTGHYAT